jgi:hypothetical protein
MIWNHLTNGDYKDSGLGDLKIWKMTNTQLIRMEIYIFILIQIIFMTIFLGPWIIQVNNNKNWKITKWKLWLFEQLNGSQPKRYWSTWVFFT